MKTLIVTTALSFLACIAQAQDDPHAGHHAETVQKAAQPGFLGVAMGEENGKVILRHVEPGSPADKAGLKTGDVIVKAGDTAVEGDQSRVVEAVKSRSAGETLEIHCQRGDKEVTVSAELGARPGQTADDQDNTLLRGVRPNIVQSIRAYRIQDLQTAAQAMGNHFLYANLATAQSKQDVLSLLR